MRRKQKIFRNLLGCLLLGACAYALLGFPPYTVRGMCRQMERDYLLQEPLEPIYVLKDSSRYVNDHARYTYVLARSGNTYISFQYEQNFLQNWRYYQHIAPKMSNGTLCTARDGILYIVGPFEGVSSATAEITAEKTLVLYDPDTEERRMVKGPETWTFTLQGEKEGEELLVFRYRNGEPDLFPEQVPETQQDLEDISDLWYRIYRIGEEEDTSAGHGLLHADLPVHVTLYKGFGDFVDTLDLTVDTYELHER